MLAITDIHKTFDRTPVLRGVSCGVVQGDIVCLLGPSGCGKSTLLRIVAGLERAERGSISLDGRVIDDVPVHERGMGLMFQDFALFPHHDVGGNVGFGLRMQGLPPAQQQTRVAEVLAQVGLAGIAGRRIEGLSGGEKQRVALARSLAPQPRLLMLDEPLGSLDRLLREQLSEDLRGIIKQAGVSALYVTHDQQEAFAVADRIVLMRAGEIAQTGTPRDLYAQPASAYVARFMGLSNILPGTVTAIDRGVLHVRTAWGVLQAQAGDAQHAVDAAVQLVVRPEAAQADALAPATWPRVRGMASVMRYRGAQLRVQLRAPAAPPLVFDVDALPEADAVLALDPARVSVVMG